jgi:hypothetical protein
MAVLQILIWEFKVQPGKANAGTMEVVLPSYHLQFFAGGRLALTAGPRSQLEAAHSPHGPLDAPSNGASPFSRTGPNVEPYESSIPRASARTPTFAQGNHSEGGTPRASARLPGLPGNPAEGGTPRATGRVPMDTTYDTSAPALAVLEWGAAAAVAGVDGEGVTSLDVSLEQVALMRYVPPDPGSGPLEGVPPMWAHVISVQPVESVESAALTGPAQEPLGLRVRWSAAETPPEGREGGGTGTLELASVHVGRLSVVYAPGFPTDMLLFLGPLVSNPATQCSPQTCGNVPLDHRPVPEDAERGGASAKSAGPAMRAELSEAMAREVEPDLAGPKGGRVTDTGAENGEAVTGETGSGSGDVSEGEMRVPPPWPHWLGGRLAGGLSILSLEVVALSGSGAGEAAAILAVSRLSAHLGPVRPGARAGSLVADL